MQINKLQDGKYISTPSPTRSPRTWHRFHAVVHRRSDTACGRRLDGVRPVIDLIGNNANDNNSNNYYKTDGPAADGGRTVVSYIYFTLAYSKRAARSTRGMRTYATDVHNDILLGRRRRWWRQRLRAKRV